jgi:hypothetical protein
MVGAIVTNRTIIIFFLLRVREEIIEEAVVATGKGGEGGSSVRSRNSGGLEMENKENGDDASEFERVRLE